MHTVMGVVYVDSYQQKPIVWKFKALPLMFSLIPGATDAAIELTLEHCRIVHDKAPLGEFVCYSVPKADDILICGQRLVEGTAILLLPVNHKFKSLELVKMVRYVKEHRGEIPSMDLKFISDVTNLCKIEKVNSQMKDIKEIMIENIEKILDRGEKLENLVERSKKLSDTSKDFYHKSKKLNSCCVML